MGNEKIDEKVIEYIGKIVDENEQELKKKGKPKKELTEQELKMLGEFSK